MKIDYMISTWRRFEIPDSYKDALLAFLKQNPTATGWQVYDWYSEQVDHDPEEETLEENDECVLPQGFSTLEVYEDVNDYPIFSNKN